jgi:S-adenosyl-L-methionine hydrolase (adenosine-forming)
VPEPADAPVVAFLSDYGLADEFVGVCKAVVLGVAPDARFVDLSHEVPPHDVKAGALTLVRAVQYLPAGAIVFAVVDPGVGTDRRLLGVECEHVTLVGPDNGLLAPAVALAGGARRIVAITNEEYRLPSPGPTFAGRDILAPAVGQLALGTDLTELGETVDANSVTPGLLGLPRIEDGGAISAEVWWVDRFGNCQLNVGPEDLEALGAEPGGPVEVHIGDQARAARWVRTYADARASELVLVVDSYGLLSLALDRRSAAAEHRLRTGSAVTLVPPGASLGSEA